MRLSCVAMIALCGAALFSADEDPNSVANYLKGQAAAPFFVAPPKTIPMTGVPNAAPGESTVGASLVKERSEQPGIVSTKLAIQSGDDAPVRGVVWSRDLKSIYLLQGNGELRKINVDTLTLEAFVQLGRTDGSGLSLSKEGLLLSLKEVQDIWILDEQTLATVRKIAVPEVLVAWSAPSLSFAFAVHGPENNPKDSIKVIDLKSKKVVKEYKWEQIAATAPTKHNPIAHVSGFEMGCLEVNRTGEWLIVPEGHGIIRLKIDGPNLTLVEQGKGETHSFPCFTLSSDGKFILSRQAIPNTGYSQNALYSILNLQTPSVLLPQVLGSNAYVRTYDSVSMQYIGESSGMQLVALDKAGKIARAYTISTKNDLTHQIYAHPLGNRYLVHTGNAFFWVQNQSDRKVAPK